MKPNSLALRLLRGLTLSVGIYSMVFLGYLLVRVFINGCPINNPFIMHYMVWFTFLRLMVINLIAGLVSIIAYWHFIRRSGNVRTDSYLSPIMFRSLQALTLSVWIISTVAFAYVASKVFVTINFPFGESIIPGFGGIFTYIGVIFMGFVAGFFASLIYFTCFWKVGPRISETSMPKPQ
jgi:hypothetical protein